MFGHLFYSNRCAHSSKFLTIISNEGIINLFSLNCIDNIKKEQLIKLSINFFPAVVVKNQMNTHIYEGNNAFKWLEGIIKFRRDNIAKIAEENRRRIIKTNKTIHNDSSGIEHSPNETLGISDEYAYLNADCPQPKSFMTYGQDNFNRIATPQNHLENKMEKNEYDAALKQYKAIKENQDQYLEQYLEQNIKTTICNKLLNPDDS